MSAMPLALLLSTAAATAVGAAALYAARGLRKQVRALRTELAAASAAERDRDLLRRAEVPGARATPAAEIRAAVAEALAEERERELAEARAFWAAQESRDAADAPSSLLGGLAGLGDDAPLFLPRQSELTGLDTDMDMDLDLAAELGLGLGLGLNLELDDAGLDDLEPDEEYAPDSPELAAARRRHPSHPDFVPSQATAQSAAQAQQLPAAAHERTVARLEELAHTRTALADVRPGPLGTLDVYVFTDGTTLCMTPGDHVTAERLAGALRAGLAPVLLGGSGIAGAYALTFSCGHEADAADSADDTVYVLADRVIASL